MKPLIASLVGKAYLLIHLALLILITSAHAQVTPRPADDFVESIGVNVHWGYTDRVYYSKFPELKERLKELGIRHVREGADSFVDKPKVTERINELFTEAGIRTTFIAGRRKRVPGSDTPWRDPLDVSQISDELQDLSTKFIPGLIEAVEGPNEYDLFHNQYENDWATKVKQYQQELYRQVKSHPDLQNLPVIAPSLTSEQAYESVGNLDASLDFACIHAYQSWRHPGTPGWGSNGYGSISWHLNYTVPRQSPLGKPVQNTECGYNNYLPENRGVPEAVQAKYLPRTFAEFFRRGIHRSFKYELVDQGTLTDQTDNPAERVFGMLRNDISRKPVFYAVRDLIDLLADPGEAFEPTPLNYSLAGNTNNVREVLLQKRDGTYYLMLWLEVEGYNGDQDVETPQEPQRVTVQLPNLIEQTTLHRQGTDGKMGNQALTIEESTVSLDVYDRMQVLELGSFDDGPAPPPTADLTVTDIMWEPAAPTAGEGVRFRATVENVGTGPTPPGTVVGVEFQVDGQQVAWSDDDSASLLPGESRVLVANGGPTGDATWTFDPEADSVQAHVNDVKRFEEINTTNNRLVVALNHQNDDESGFPEAFGWFYVQNRECGTYLSADECQRVVLSSEQTEAQQWQLINTGEGYYALQNQACTDLMITTNDECSGVNLLAGALNDDVRWELVESESGYYYLENKACRKRLDADSCLTVDIDPGKATDKRWQFVAVASEETRMASKPQSNKGATMRLTAYPNPSSADAIQVSWSGFQPSVQMLVTNTKGETVYRAMHNEASAVLLPAFPPGLYILRVSDARGTLTEKLLIR